MKREIPFSPFHQHFALPCDGRGNRFGGRTEEGRIRLDDVQRAVEVKAVNASTVEWVRRLFEKRTTRAELADILGVHRGTVSRDVLRLLRECGLFVIAANIHRRVVTDRISVIDPLTNEKPASHGATAVAVAITGFDRSLERLAPDDVEDYLQDWSQHIRLPSQLRPKEADANDGSLFVMATREDDHFTLQLADVLNDWPTARQIAITNCRSEVVDLAAMRFVPVDDAGECRPAA